MKAGDKNIWTLTDEEIVLLNQLNSGRALDSDLDLTLSEIWPYYEEMPEGYLSGINIQKTKGPELMSTNQVRAMIEAHGVKNVKPTALVHSLERYCGKFTGTLAEEKSIAPGKVIIRGRLCSGWDDKRRGYQHSKWVMPKTE
jgi:hypothetical protein